MIRVSEVHSIPHYHEWVPLQAKVRTRVWVVAAVMMVAGFASIALVDAAPVTALGQMSVVLGGLALALLFRWRRYEVDVGTKRTDLGTGPFRRILPTGAIESTLCRPATSWRRLFADEEVVFRVSVGADEIVVPTRTPGALVAALEELAGREPSANDGGSRTPRDRGFRVPAR